MDRPSIDAYYLEMVAVAAKRSTCPRRTVGAILVNERNVIIGVGHNGSPRGLIHCGDPGSQCTGAFDAPGDTRRCLAIHAEVNAILQCADIWAARTLYCSATPCFACAKIIANTGVVRVVCATGYDEPSPSGWSVLVARGIKVEHAYT